MPSETGIRSGDCNGRGYAPIRDNPYKKVKGRIEKVNMISAITNQGTVRFEFYEGNSNMKFSLIFLVESSEVRKRKCF